MGANLKKGILSSTIFLLIIVGTVSFNYLDQKLISTHQHFLYCQLITPEASSKETMRILKSIRSSDYVYDEILKEVRGNFSDPVIKHLFGGPFRSFFKNDRYMGTAIAKDGSTWITVKCDENARQP